MTRPRRPEHPLLNNRGLDRAACLILLACTLAIFLLMWFPSTQAVIQRWDNTIQQEMVEARGYPAFTPIAMVFNVLGSFWVMFPIRIARMVELAPRKKRGTSSAAP